MPGKSQASSRGKQEASKEALNSSSASETGGRKFSIWPEWSEAELAAEKFDLGGGKGKDKGKASQSLTLHEDPEGVLLPPSLNAVSDGVCWKRPTDVGLVELFGDEAPVVVHSPDSTEVDLVSNNTHLLHSEFMCWVMSQLITLWQVRHELSVDHANTGGVGGDTALLWAPWDHIYPQQKGSPTPLFNATGKYCVRLYWMGCWRKVTVDDLLPFVERPLTPQTTSEESTEPQKMFYIPLFPRTSHLNELWPAILTKAILKIAALDYNGGSEDCEYGEASIIHMFSGWIPEYITVRVDKKRHIWETLMESLPLWSREELEENESLSVVEEEGGDDGVGAEDSQVEEVVEKATRMEKKKQKKKNGCIVMASLTPKATTAAAATTVKEISKNSFCVDDELSPVVTRVVMSWYEEHHQKESDSQQTSSTDLQKQQQQMQLQISESFSQFHPTYPVFVSQIRDQPLVSPPTEPPLPLLQFPYYLGLKHRKRSPAEPTPPPTPPPIVPEFLQIFSPFAKTSLRCTLSESLSSASEDGGGSSGESRKTSCEETKDGNGGGDGGDGEEVNRDVWMEYVKVFHTFRTLCVFRDPASFTYRQIYSDLSLTVENCTQPTSAVKKNTSTAQLASTSKPPAPSKPQDCLFVDSVESVLLHFTFASLSNWREGQKNTHSKFKKRFLSLANFTSRDRHGQTSKETEDQEYIAPGSVIVEPYTWTTLQGSPPVLKVVTSAIKGTTLSLPPGRHVFKLHMRSPIGHHLEVLSGSDFTLCDEDHLFTLIKKESSRYLSHCSLMASTLLSAAEQCVAATGDGGDNGDGGDADDAGDAGEGGEGCDSGDGSGGDETLRESLKPLLKEYHTYGLTLHHIHVLFACVLETWFNHGPKQFNLTDKMLFAWKALLYKVFEILQQDLIPDHKRSEPDDSLSVRDLRRRLAALREPIVETPPVPDNWTDRMPRLRELSAARLIQTALQEYVDLLRAESMNPGSERNGQTLEQLKESLELLRPHQEQLGRTIISTVFQLEPSMMKLFPFYSDEKSRTFSKMYSGVFPQLQPNAWTIIMREVFHVQRSQLLVPRLQCPLSSCLLQVIDNDTHEEIPRLFQTTPPHTYSPNQHGYTLQAEAWNNSASDLVESGKWNLRIISLDPDLPVLGGTVEEGGASEGEGLVEEVTTTFYNHDFIDYCLPDREKRLFRYNVRANEDCCVSVQLYTSKQDALCKLQILDYEEPVAEIQGRGHCVLPLNTIHGSPPSVSQTILEEQVAAPVPDDKQAHKYIIQATVLRDSWPSSDTSWPYIAMIRSMEKLEERPLSSSQKPDSAKKSKGGKSKKGSTPQPSNTQVVAPQIDTSKPYWILRVVCKNSDKDTLQITKNTERADDLKNMVKAWESEQPGRTKKAQESRQKFLESRAIKEERAGGGGSIDGSATAAPAATEEEQRSTAVSVMSEGSSFQIPLANTGPVKIWQMDRSQFTVKAKGSPRLLDEEEKQARVEERVKEFKEYRANRHTVIELRDLDRQQRNESKVKQLELAEKWQTELDETRNELNKPREAFRESVLAKEKAKREAEQAALKAQEQQQAASGGRESTTGKKGGKGKKK